MDLKGAIQNLQKFEMSLLENEEDFDQFSKLEELHLRDFIQDLETALLTSGMPFLEAYRIVYSHVKTILSEAEGLIRKKALLMEKRIMSLINSYEELNNQKTDSAQ